MDFPYRTGSECPLFLAPMAGVSESPFRLLCRRFGADVVVSEFISAVGVARGLEHLFQDMRFEEAERPIGIQLYGADATVMARAAEMVTAVMRPDFLDINFGCPGEKGVKNNGGAGCLKDLDLVRSEEHTSELQSLAYLVCRLLLGKKKKTPQAPRSASTC